MVAGGAADMAKISLEPKVRTLIAKAGNNKACVQSNAMVVCLGPLLLTGPY